MKLQIIIILSIFFFAKSELTYEVYENKRGELNIREEKLSLGSDIQLSEQEEKANEIILALKKAEIDYGFDNPQYFNFSKSYFQFKEDIENSEVYKIIKRMPKGAGLHYHATGIMGSDYLLNITYMENLYICFGNNERENATTLNYQFLFADTIPTTECNTTWELIEDARNSSYNVTEFDMALKRSFVQSDRFTKLTESDINTVWTEFQTIFDVTGKLIQFRPVWEKYVEDTLYSFLDDGIMYVELRSGLSSLYELNGTEHDKFYTASSIKKITEKFKQDNPEFLGLKVIYSTGRLMEIDEIDEDLNITQQLMEEMPNFIAGFDLVGQEDLGRPLKDFAAKLVEANVPFFFHAGETDWYGITDENLVDAVALGSKRLGHGFALTKHPAVAKAVNKYGIGIEVNVISNQVLALVDDFRDHPLAYFLANDFPVVLSGDDPGLWDAPPLSHDFYIAWVGIANENADIRMLKQLALNSIKYSAMTKREKKIAKRFFNHQWDAFISDVINTGSDLDDLEIKISWQ